MTTSETSSGGWLSHLIVLKPRQKRTRTELPLVRYDDDISLGPSPTIREIEVLARKRRFRSLLNLNTEGESGQLLSPNVEATWAHTFDMQHERVSVDPDYMRSQCVDRFLETVAKIAKPVYVHSLEGSRAAAMMIIYLGLERGCPGRTALTEAAARGIACLERFESFVEAEVDLRIEALNREE